MTPRESLTESEAGYLTWFYCLMCQPKFKEQPFREIGREKVTPPSLYDREPRDWLGEPPTCRKILSDLVQRQLRELMKREHILIYNYEEPARDGAELRRQVLTTPEGTRLLRHERAHMQMFHRSFGAFEKGRLQSLKTGRPPGVPDRDGDEAGQARAAAEPGPGAGSDAMRVAEEKARRQEAAAAVAPGAANGIGAPDGDADGMMTAVMAAREETLAQEQAQAETQAQAG